MCDMYKPWGPYGVPVTAETLAQYSPELQAAWECFFDWFYQSLTWAQGGLVDREKMPERVRLAMELILETEIPGYPGLTGKSSCSMNFALSMMTEEGT